MNLLKFFTLARITSWLLVLSLFVGCSASTPQPSKQRPVAIAVIMPEGQMPTSAQLSQVHRALAPEIAARGLTLVQNPEGADYVLAVRFYPDQFTNQGGHVTIIGIQPNPKNRRGPSQLEQMKAEADVITQRTNVY